MLSKHNAALLMLFNASRWQMASSVFEKFGGRLSLKVFRRVCVQGSKFEILANLIELKFSC